MLYVAAFLMTALGLAHSILGERLILIRLFRRGDLPKLFGGTEFTMSTLRFAWHLTTVAWLGLATVLVELASPASAPRLISIIGWTLILSGVLPLILTRGRHLSWVVLFAAGGLCILWGTH